MLTRCVLVARSPMLIANAVRQIGKQISSSVITEDDIKRVTPAAIQTALLAFSTGVVQIKEIARRKDYFDLLGGSIAPSIYGHRCVRV